MTKFKKTVLHLLSISYCLLTLNGHAQTQEVPDKMTWWEDAKFGMFMHWGLYSQTAGYWDGRKAKGKEHFMLHERIPWKEYAKIADDFNPVNFDAEKWVLTAKDAGMKYIIITAKHHEGFAMFNSPSSDYNIVERTPYGKDPMKALVAACRKYDIKFGFYYSLGRDWQDPDVPTNWPEKAGRSNTWDFPDEDGKVFNNYFERKVKPQIKELLTQYGDIDIMWFDTPELISVAESKELRSLILDFQPNCIINSRIGNNEGDYLVTEQEIVKKTLDKPWEACITMSRNWGYVEYDTIYKSSELMTRQLLEIVSKGGNLLLNNGPTPEGEITQPASDRLAQMGNWMSKNSEGIYGASPWKISNELLSEMTQNSDDKKSDKENTMKDAENDATSKLIFPEVSFTTKDGYVYAYVASATEPNVMIKAFALEKQFKIKAVKMLGTEQKVTWTQTTDGLNIKLPQYSENEIPITGYQIELNEVD
ncbi:alpha-L-fucosidase [Gelidibacter salicanalis]|uniref:alpha-L-fucosidase n=1 Tax=Gelidibacter salicanalis TaxID=291193 RepID=A0A934NK96_9FLAO|nr:alpha-L-fucosidase [Gelidibacter salicanalis]MBJ7882989.1 alpha-L-fucosidase [Gelidibacter salicanalis]